MWIGGTRSWTHYPISVGCRRSSPPWSHIPVPNNHEHGHQHGHQEKIGGTSGRGRRRHFEEEHRDERFGLLLEDLRPPSRHEPRLARRRALADVSLRQFRCPRLAQRRGYHHPRRGDSQAGDERSYTGVLPENHRPSGEEILNLPSRLGSLHLEENILYMM